MTMLAAFSAQHLFTANWERGETPRRRGNPKALKSSVVYPVKGFGMNIPACLSAQSTRANRDTAVSTIFVAVFGSPMSPSTSARFAEAGRICFGNVSRVRNHVVTDPEKLSQDCSNACDTGDNPLFFVCLPFLRFLLRA